MFKELKEMKRKVRIFKGLRKKKKNRSMEKIIKFEISLSADETNSETKGFLLDFEETINNLLLNEEAVLDYKVSVVRKK